MPLRKRIDRKYLSSRKLSLSGRLSGTPQKHASHKKLVDNTSNSSDQVKSPSVNPVKCLNNANDGTPITSEKCLDVSVLLKGNLQVFRVSPLYNFDKRKSRIYEKRLKEELASINHKMENAIYECKFSFGNLLLDEMYNIIQVHVQGNGNKYIGHIISFANASADEGFLSIQHFPILLVQAGGKILKQVHNVICKFFDCDIQLASFSFRALITFFTSLSHIYVERVPDLSSEVVTLHFKIPGSAASDSIVIDLSLAATSTAFAVLNHELNDKLNSTELISTFYERIINHIFNVYRIDFSPAELWKIVFPSMVVSSEGLVRFTSKEVIQQALLIIQDFIKLENLIHF